jgi:hypothetical protein
MLEGSQGPCGRFSRAIIAFFRVTSTARKNHTRLLDESIKTRCLETKGVYRREIGHWKCMAEKRRKSPALRSAATGMEETE